MNLNQFGIIGLGVMGRNLALNFVDNGIKLAVFNRQVPGREVNLAQKFSTENPGSEGFDDFEQFISSLEKPRKILMMVNAGKPVDDVISKLIPFLEPGDIIMDGGNSHFSDTKRRVVYLAEKNLLFLGIGISGGQEGARTGPSTMPGGPLEGYKEISKYIDLISAKDLNNLPCSTYVGPEGAGHFIKMVHNGIEYAEMQIIAEIYYLMRFMLQYTPDKISNIFYKWNVEGEGSYLLEISSKILLIKEGNELLLDKILDVAEQKETGGWSVKAALDLGSPLSTIATSVQTRMISMLKSKRVKGSEIYKSIIKTPHPSSLTDEELKSAFISSRLINHIIGFDMMKDASDKYFWNLDLSQIARIWTGGCIIKSPLMEKISYDLKSEQELLFHPDVVNILVNNHSDLSKVVSVSLLNYFPVPVLSTASSYFYSIVSGTSSANMIQAQRDFFGAHTYRRIDKPENEYFHTDW
ncbi:MAG: NADP-dependent phosphogluconate dehydrogenase [Opitutaceae bacterium]|nr:NADP-dependent phosphogluconate dehydrogenase [Cytophagales bacterium]